MNLLKKINKQSLEQLPIMFIIWGWFLIDIWNRFLLTQASVYDYKLFPSIVFRGVIILGLSFYLFVLRYKSRSRIEILLFFSVISIVLVSYLFDFRTFDDVKYLIKLFAPFVFFIYFNELKFPDKNRWIMSQMKWLFLVHVIFVLIGFFFKLDLFRSYPGSERFGFSGIIPRTSISDASFFSIIAFLIVYSEYVRKKINIIYISFITLGLLMLGTKALYLSLGLFGLFLIVYKTKNVIRNIFFAVGILLLLITLIYTLTDFFNFYINLFEDNGLWYVLSSKRNTHLIDIFYPYIQNISFTEWLIGGGGFHDTYVEMDVLDLFVSGGLLGVIMYIILLKATLFSFSKRNYIGWFLVSQYFLIGGLAGHAFASGINAMYLALICYYLQQYDHGRIVGGIPEENRV